ncbi:hypothetical protein LSAT2_001010 [Lamellibrachia satsuma]|nr:hypothetical protein LSAT2_001010 [Lamellibrachia satsuma]
MSTDTVKTKLSYRDITQKVTLHMTPNTEFNLPHSSSLGLLLGLAPPVIISPTTVADNEYIFHRRGAHQLGLAPSVIISPTTVADNEYIFHRRGAHQLGLSPSTTVKSTDVYSYRKEGDAVMDMNEGFDTLYVYTDVVESRIVGDSLVPLLRMDCTVGGALPYFVGAREQRGHGLGSVFGSLLCSAMPFIKRGAVALGKRALRTVNGGNLNQWLHLTRVDRSNSYYPEQGDDYLDFANTYVIVKTKMTSATGADLDPAAAMPNVRCNVHVSKDGLPTTTDGFPVPANTSVRTACRQCTRHSAHS